MCARFFDVGTRTCGYPCTHDREPTSQIAGSTRPWAPRCSRSRRGCCRTNSPTCSVSRLLQIGRWGDAGQLCAGARTQHRRWIAPDAEGHGAIRADYDALPIATNSVEAVLLPHTLEHTARPHELLREVDRVLVGEGNVVICAFSPWGPWGVRHYFARGQFPPHAARLMSEHRTRDWLSLLGFEIVSARRYLFAPPWTQFMLEGRPEQLARASRPEHRAATGRRVPAQGAQARACGHADPPRVDAPSRHRRRRARADDEKRRVSESRASRQVEIYTDGACKGNPGPGGWGALLVSGDASPRDSMAASRTPPTIAWS